MRKLLTPFRVGLLVLFAGGMLFVLLNFVKKGGLSQKEALAVYGVFKDASGLGRRSRVQIAGIPVGEISEIELVGNRAKVWMKIRRDIPLHDDATLKKRSESLLGDYMLDLYPGSDQVKLLQDGDEIRTVVDAQGMDQVLDQATKIASDVQEVTSSLRRALGGEKGAQSLEALVANLVSASGELDRTIKDNSKQLNRIVNNVEAISADVRGITGKEKQNVEVIIENVQQVSEDAREVARALREAVGPSAPAPGGSVTPAGKPPGGSEAEEANTIRDAIARLDRSLANLEEITKNLKEGKGTAGELLSDERLGKKVAETVEDLSDYANRLTRLQTELGIRSEYLFSQGAGKNIITLKIVPRPDKFYLLEAVDDPRGEVTEVLVQNNPPSTGQPTTQVQRTTKDAFKFTAQVAKRYYFATLRLGVMESTGGVGADLNFFDDQLQLKLDAFNFSVQSLAYPRIRATLRLNLFDHLVATAGMDDMLNQQVRDSFSNRLLVGRDFFVGAGVYFTDDDLKAVLPVVPVP
ncbi:MAG TPA: MlaD family protein [Myxococcales bacterium]|nr:MlaD family protein [Myxococcales bacterium]